MKNPLNCPECKSSYIIKSGKRKRKYRTLQQYKCNSCGRFFLQPRMEKKGYPPNVILASLSCYNTDSTLKAASKRINKQFGVKTYPQLISHWLKEFRSITTYQRIRKETGPAENLLVEQTLRHKQSYRFKYHRVKLDRFVNEYFSPLKEYLERIPEGCPDELFLGDNLRSSRLSIVNGVSVDKKENYACQIADLALKGVTDNKKRHEAVQDFMLCNDTATLAVEVPVWLYPDESDLELLAGIDKPITGHIDILQLRYGLIYILDYKPEAESVKPISQLFSYALALSKRTGIWLRNIRCAWFDDSVYYEFSPAEMILAHESIPTNEKMQYVLDERAKGFYTSLRYQELRKSGDMVKDVVPNSGNVVPNSRPKTNPNPNPNPKKN